MATRTKRPPDIVTSPRTKKAHPKFLPVPADALRRITAAGCHDIHVAKIVLGLLNAIIGFRTDEMFRDENWELSAIETLPHSIRHHARQIFEWGSHRSIILNEVVAARRQVSTAVLQLRRNSPYGRRRRRIATALRNEHPPLKPDGAQRPDRLEALPVLDDDVGRPIGPATIRRALALGPSRIEINNATDPSYCALRERAITIRLLADGFTIDQITMAVVVEKAPRESVIYGVLEDFFETGTEGVVWSVLDDDDTGYDGLHPIEEGDHLTILDQLGRPVWRGRIRCDRKAGWSRYPLNPEYGQPCALGYWVHWTQQGFKPDDWARFFIRSGGSRFRAILRKAQERRP